MSVSVSPCLRENKRTIEPKDPAARGYRARPFALSQPTNHVIPMEPQRLRDLVSSCFRAATWTILNPAQIEIRATRQ